MQDIFARLRFSRTKQTEDREYRYKALPNRNSFRCLELLPGKEYEEVRYRLKLADFRHPPSYEAISYAWGEPNTMVTSICDGKILEITPNLKAGLRALRHEHRSRLLWADAICINQSHVVEKNNQVANMQKIYENATRVVAWLGLDENCEQGNSSMTTIAAAAVETVVHDTIKYYNSLSPILRPEIRIRPPEFSLSQTLPENLSLLPREGTLHVRQLSNIYNIADLCSRFPFEPHRLPKEHMKSLMWLFSRPWFTRLWVIQEISSSIQPAILQCGTTQMPWDHIAFCAYWLHIHFEAVQQSFPDFDLNCLFHATAMRAMYGKVGPLEILHIASHFHASDPRDHLYAVLGHPRLKDILSLPTPDYNISHKILFATIAQWTIQHFQNLDILSYVQRPGQFTGDFPSWIPQWQHPSTMDLFIGGEASGWKAGGSNPLFKFPRHMFLGDRLHANGFILDKVVGIFTYTSPEAFNSHHPMDGLRATDRHPILVTLQRQQRLSQKYWNGEPSSTAIGMAWAAGMVVADLFGEYAINHRDLFEADFAAFLEHLKDSQEGVCTPHCIPRRQHVGCWQQYLNCVDSATLNRRFITTSQGYVGLAPNTIREGDVICILFGGKVPFALTPEGSHYRLLGECYIHGIMQGEAIDMLEVGKFKRETIEIR